MVIETNSDTRKRISLDDLLLESLIEPWIKGFLQERLGVSPKPGEVAELPYNLGQTKHLEEKWPSYHFWHVFCKKLRKLCVYGNPESDDLFVGGYDLPTDEHEARIIFPNLHIHFPSHRKFLDWGCGDGFPLTLSLILGYDSYGVDNDPRKIEKLKENLSKLGLNPERAVNGFIHNGEIRDKDQLVELGIPFEQYDIFYFFTNNILDIYEVGKVMSPGAIVAFPDESRSRQYFGERRKIPEDLKLKHFKTKPLQETILRDWADFPYLVKV